MAQPTRAKRRREADGDRPPDPIEPGAPESAAESRSPAADLDLVRRIGRRALAQMVAMIWRANHREGIDEGDPKVGGHPAACASCLEIHAALHLVVREPQDYFCSKPHAAPMDHTLFLMLDLFRHKDGRWFDDAESQAVMTRLRDFAPDAAPVFQSYHSEFDPDCWRILPSGTVGIPPVNAAYLALAYRYANTHGKDLGTPHFWCMMGDSEFREGSLMEALPEVAERELGNVTWIVDYNRQSLDGTRTPNARGLEGTDADRIERTCSANGWHVIQLRHGRFRCEVFARSGGTALREAFEKGLTDFRFQTLVWKKDVPSMRAALLELAPRAKALIDSLADGEIVELFRDVGGHDLQLLVEAFTAAKSDARRPTMIIAHTLKGRGLRCEAATGNHSAIPEEDEVKELLAREGLEVDRPFANFAPDSSEGRFLLARSRAFRAGIEHEEAQRTANLRAARDAIAAAGGVPESLEINLKLAPLAHTQWMWGQLASKLIRIGVHDELAKAGKPAGRDLDAHDQRWGPVADLVLTMAPDVGTSTNINPAMDHKVFGPESEIDWEELLAARERNRPQVAPTDEAWSRHIRFDIAEANCTSAMGSFGKMAHFAGVPLLPMMTVYDFFIKRALDQLYYDLYWNSSFVLVGTPSGVTLAPEGAQHSWKSDIQMPNLVTWEPSFAHEIDWILCDAMRRHFAGDDAGRKGVLIRAVTRALRQDLLLSCLRRQARSKSDLPAGALLAARAGDGGLPEQEVPARTDRELLEALRADVLAGGYRLVDWRGYRGYEPGENVVHLVTMGALVREAVEASEQLLARGIYCDVIVASSPELLCGLLAEKDGYRHLRLGLGVDGTLHLGPRAAAGRALEAQDVIDLAGRRIPIVSVHDGEAGLLDNLGSIAGVRQVALAVRKFSKSGTPEQVFRYHGLDTESIVAACGKALAETALEDLRLSPSAWAALQRDPSSRAAGDWRSLWPEPRNG
ncbi:MAG: pyruvate dehydrogenase [Planctomycetes bacterium]|nr:pyruvate dehydrogenase [Planctomycetota bacterium]